MNTQPDPEISLHELAGAHENLATLPPPSLDLTQETRAVDSLLDAGHELMSLEPPLVPLVCQMVLRELGRFPETQREALMFETLAMTPPEDETILRMLVERIPPIRIVKWLLAHPEPNGASVVKRLERLFRSVPPHALGGLLEDLVRLESAHRAAVSQALSVVGTRIAHLLRPICENAAPPDAARLLNQLLLAGDKAVAPLVSQLLRRIDQSELTLIEAAIKLLSTTGDRAFVASVEPYLAHASVLLRMAAANAIGTLGGTLACEHLDRVIKQRNAGSDERRTALTALASIDSEEARRRLRKFARPGIFGGLPEPLRAHAAALLETHNAQDRCFPNA
ncbi:MAG TPA: hypothetical protein DCM87_19925 [Planctomycetes bacterium]|nr:hypothetical protein [Planctomycetota bacterium]